MRKIITGTVLFASALIMAGMVYARGPMGFGAGDCGRPDCLNAGSATTDQWQKFRADSLGLREAMMTKKFEIEKELLQTTPDKTRITKLENELSALQASVQGLRTKAGLAGCDQSGSGCRNGGMNVNCGSGMASFGQGRGRCCP